MVVTLVHSSQLPFSSDLAKGNVFLVLVLSLVVALLEAWVVLVDNDEGVY